MPEHQQANKDTRSKSHLQKADVPSHNEFSRSELGSLPTQQSKLAPHLMTSAQIIYLQRAIGNAAVQKYLMSNTTQSLFRTSQINVPSNPVLNNTIVQREPITEEEAIEALAWRAEAFYKVPYKIITPWGDKDKDSNCHGYTVNGKVGNFIDHYNLLEQIGPNEGIAVFVKNDQIAHSGRLNGQTLTHLLIGVGILESTINDSTMGYEARYDLPKQRNELDEYLKQVNIKIDAKLEHENNISFMTKVVYEAANTNGLKKMPDFLDDLYDLKEDPNHPEKENIIKAYNEFALQYPKAVEAVKKEMEENSDDY